MALSFGKGAEIFPFQIQIFVSPSIILTNVLGFFYYTEHI